MIIYDSSKPLISLHVAKCAGQSFRRVLEQWFGDNFFIHYFQQYNTFPPKHVLRPGICIHGHFNHVKRRGVQDYYPEAEQFITVLRDPLEAAISHYFYWKTKVRPTQIKQGVIEAGGVRDYRNIDDFFTKRPKSMMLDFMPCNMSAENYKDIIETKFIWIGLVENLQLHVDRLATKLGFAKTAVERLNTAPRNEELSSDIRRDFIRNSQLEFEIYDYVKEYLSKRSN